MSLSGITENKKLAAFTKHYTFLTVCFYLFLLSDPHIYGIETCELDQAFLNRLQKW